MNICPGACDRCGRLTPDELCKTCANPLPTRPHPKPCPECRRWRHAYECSRYISPAFRPPPPRRFRRRVRTERAA